MKLIMRMVLLTLFPFFLLSCGQLAPFVPAEDERPDPIYRVIWSKNLDPVYNSGNLPISFNAPLIHEGLLFMGDPSGRVAVFHLENGRVVWSVKEKRPFVGQPSIFGDYVLYGNDSGRLVARNYLTGVLHYQVDLGEALESAGTIYQGRAIYHLRNHKVVCLDASTGKILWTYNRPISTSPTIHGTSRPFPYQNKILVGLADGYLAALALEDGTLLWEQKLSTGQKFVDVDNTPALIDQVLYTSSFGGPLTLVRPDTGVLLQKLTLNPARAPLVDQSGSNLLLGTVQGKVYRLGKANEILEEKGLTAGAITSYTLWNNHFVVAATNGKIYFLDPKTLVTRGIFHLGSKNSTVFGPMQSQGNILSFYSSRNRLYVLSASAPIP